MEIRDTTELTTNQIHQIQHTIATEGPAHDLVAYHKIYADMANDLIAGLLLSQIVYYHMPDSSGRDTKLRISRDGHLWIVKRRDDWDAECRIKPRQWDRAAAILEERSLIIVRRYRTGLYGGAPVLHIRLNWAVFGTRYKELVASRNMARSAEPMPESTVDTPGNNEYANSILQMRNMDVSIPPDLNIDYSMNNDIYNDSLSLASNDWDFSEPYMIENYDTRYGTASNTDTNEYPKHDGQSKLSPDRQVDHTNNSGLKNTQTGAIGTSNQNGLSVGRKHRSPAKIVRDRPFPLSGPHGLWAQIEDAVGVRLVREGYQYKNETSALDVLLAEYPDLTMDDMLAYVRYRRTCYGTTPAAAATLHGHTADFSAWISAGRPTTQADLQKQGVTQNGQEIAGSDRRADVQTARQHTGTRHRGSVTADTTGGDIWDS